MTIFLVLNGMAIVFLLYVLVSFWEEGARTTHGGIRLHKLQSVYESRPMVFVLTRLQASEAVRPANRSLIQFPVSQMRPQEDIHTPLRKRRAS
jgi:hypothetical protein